MLISCTQSTWDQVPIMAFKASKFSKVCVLPVSIGSYLCLQLLLATVSYPAQLALPLFPECNIPASRLFCLPETLHPDLSSSFSINSLQNSSPPITLFPPALPDSPCQHPALFSLQHKSSYYSINVLSYHPTLEFLVS